MNILPKSRQAAEPASTTDEPSPISATVVLGEEAVSDAHGPLPVVQRPSHARKSPSALFGAVDVGTNSIHLIMAEITPEGDFRILGRDKEMVQMGRGGFVEHVLTERAMNEGLATLTRFMKMARLKGITRVKAVATSAVREATNGGEFVRRVREQLGLKLHVVTAEEEARLIYLAVRHAVDLGEQDNLILDIGGGSVEMIVGNRLRSDGLYSAKLGALRLAELFMHSDPPIMRDLRAMRRHIEIGLRPLVEVLAKQQFARCIGTSGTFQNLATVCAYRRGATEIEPVNRLRVTRAELKSLLSDLSHMTRDQRVKIPGIDARRTDTILPAGVLLLTLMRAVEVNEVEYCDMALREGIILDHLTHQRAHLRARAMWPDPRMRSVIQLAERCGYHQDHAEQVSRLALVLFDELKPVHGLDDSYRDLFKYGCMLHDIGYLISHQGHHKHSYYLIRNGGLYAFGEREVEIIANVARYHRKGRPKKSHYSYGNLSTRDRIPVRKMAALLRLANALDRTHYSVVESLQCTIEQDRVRVLVQTEKDAELELWTARRQSDLFEREFRRSLEMELAGSGIQEKDS